MCQGFGEKKENSSNQGLLKTYGDFGNQAVSSPANLGLAVKRQNHKKKRLDILMEGGDDIGPPGF